jgi:hypothetical protein
MKHYWGVLDSALKGVRAHRAVMDKLGRVYDVPVGDPGPALPKRSDVFLDLGHLTPVGMKLFADYVTATIVQAGLIPSPKVLAGAPPFEPFQNWK